METYSEHNIDDDPMVFLGCGHFFAISTLDGQLEMHKVYRRSSGEEFTGVLPLRTADINEKPKCCPECRTPITNVLRYGRLLQLSGLRALERKHMMMTDAILKAVSDNLESPNASANIESALNRIECEAPMRKVFEACGGLNDIEPRPPDVQLLRCLELKGAIYSHLAETMEDNEAVEATAAYKRGIEVATKSESKRSSARLRVSLVKLMLKVELDVEKIRDEATQHLRWVLDNARLFRDLYEVARELQPKVDGFGTISRAEIEQVVGAMRIRDGYDYGGSAASHWYECPNGHPYFIGECGGAMQTATCPECGERVGGQNHQLLLTNRSVGGEVGSVLRTN